MYSPKSIANYFLDLAAANGEKITPMKLQKLVYYAHGWYAGNTHQPLIDETVEAWQYGPVIPSLYREFRHYGSGYIKTKATEATFTGVYEVPIPADPNVRAFLSNVWNSYGKYTGIALSEMTHASGTPWDQTWNENPGVKGMDIPFDRIVGWFGAAVAKSQQPQV
ncbi:Panacea domain-containing protein [Pseudomonas brassicacearum]|uniref:DUF4065 domain-containing protein n=1 Tax=Pseudomonas brassicacearum subsp. neoaurantiaca TaxID=494916 RepID=A0A7V8UH41_9PSED|nr:type II toxin-antitoxin system antitoxin SocA domain-containing protein [Pseudomonas brassicacearum]MBA1381446.1 DUF4065 domain-containing protein [Pseudomonas brassicacearum subsp. neoaurantiaca]